MTTPVTTAAPDADDIDLEYTRTIRKKMVTALVKGGDVPSDPKEAALLLQTLDGIDRAALTKKRLKSDEGMSNTMVMAAEVISQLFNDPRLKRMGKVGEGHGEIPLLREMPDAVLVPGELDALPPMENYASFMERNAGAPLED